MTPIRVVIVDDHAVFREGLRALLARVNEIDVVGEAATTGDAISQVAETHPDVVLMDLHIPGEGGIHATSVVVGGLAPPAVLVLTMNADDSHVRRAIAAGARGYLLKDAQPDAIVRAIISLHEGQLVFDAGIAEQILQPGHTQSTARPFPTLTAREYEVLERLSLGLRNEAIAARLGISTKTVQNTVSAIFIKLRARDRGHAIAIARDAGVGSTG
ncbi:response regulator transcription factor [Microbacterium sp. DT81.1]|uniref:response regulator transcription factor n=1 Tax=Microbacterium sp. DT81.1 TaxID=3393413 RepID=UPI003CEE1401